MQDRRQRVENCMLLCFYGSPLPKSGTFLDVDPTSTPETGGMMDGAMNRRDWRVQRTGYLIPNAARYINQMQPRANPRKILAPCKILTTLGEGQRMPIKCRLVSFRSRRLRTREASKIARTVEPAAVSSQTKSPRSKLVQLFFGREGQEVIQKGPQMHRSILPCIRCPT